MQLRPEQLEAHLAGSAGGAPSQSLSLRPLYTVHGDEPLLAQEAADAIRAAARATGHTERTVFTVSGNHFDWSAVLGAAQAMSLFAERRLIEIRIPSGKPGKEGSEALQRYCDHLPPDVVTLVSCPKLDFQQTKSAWFAALERAGVVLKVETIERKALPPWLAQRLARQGQRVASGPAGQQALAWLADRVEGNLLAAHQEIQKLALLYPAGELAFEQVEAAVLDVARYDVFKLGEAVFAGQVPRALRMLDGLRAEGDAAVLLVWTLSEDLRSLARVRAALDDGRPLPLAMREARAWGQKEKLFERLAPQLSGPQLQQLVEAASVCDGLAKGLKHPDWPLDPWDGLRRLVLMMLQAATGGRTTLALAA